MLKFTDLSDYQVGSLISEQLASAFMNAVTTGDLNEVVRIQIKIIENLSRKLDKIVDERNALSFKFEPERHADGGHYG